MNTLLKLSLLLYLIFIPATGFAHWWENYDSPQEISVDAGAVALIALIGAYGLKKIKHTKHEQLHKDPVGDTE